MKKMEDTKLNRSPGKATAGNRKYIASFLSAALLALLVFRIIPAMYTVYMSFTNWNLYDSASAKEFVGLHNYIKLFSDPRFSSALGVTFTTLTACVSLSVVFGSIMAFIMYEEVRFSKIVRGIIISSMIMAPIVIGTTWKLMYNVGNGAVNIVLQFLGMEEIPFLSLQSTALWAIVVANVWQESPLVMVIVLSGLYGISDDILEASKVDGAGYLKRVRHIILPQISKSILLAVLFRTIDSLKIFDLIWSMTKGGPGKATVNLNVMIYQEAFEEFQFGSAAAISTVNLLLILCACLGVIVLMKPGVSQD